MRKLGDMLLEGVDFNVPTISAIRSTVAKIKERAQIVEDLAASGFRPEHPVWSWLYEEHPDYPASSLDGYLRALEEM